MAGIYKLSNGKYAVVGKRVTPQEYSSLEGRVGQEEGAVEIDKTIALSDLAKIKEIENHGN